ncbi:DUF1294 domain-containing protein [Neobacillus sp. LXY-1]|uniref:DUF1294 domain-containing protein n=1 Tax=Bacillaceae TaxID=186817 RepID=UPI003EDF4ED7
MQDGKMIVLITYLIINLIGFIIMGVDKKKAEKHQYRIPERTLWLVALFGGAIGTTAGMQLFRHKTKHASFKFGFPLLAIIELILFLKLWL